MLDLLDSLTKLLIGDVQALFDALEVGLGECLKVVLLQ